MASGVSPVGKTKDVGYEIGVRRTFDLTPDRAWELITSPDGLAAWLGEGAALIPEKGADYQTTDGARGQVTVFKPGSHLRLTWQPGGWPRPSTIQVRVIAGPRKATISFHQEHLPGPHERIAMRDRWDAALGRLAELAGQQ